MHDFSIITLSDNANIMFCRKCGYSFELYTVSRLGITGYEWRFIPFMDENGGEYGTINTPSCLDIEKGGLTTYQDATEKGII